MFILEIYICVQCLGEHLNSSAALDCCSGQTQKNYACENCRERYKEQARAQVCCTGYKLQKIGRQFQLVRNDSCGDAGAVK